MNSSEDDVSTSTFITRKSSSGRPEMQVWNHFNKTVSSSRGHYAATCNYCEKIWARGKPDELQNHLASECDNTRLNDNKRNSINQALGRFFITCSIPFAVVEHPFFVEFCKQLKPAYDPPSHTSISNTILNSENA
ncbi:10903_t:CDS:2 [Entrophospora sp. SA101]|nr:1113_t:CDS:2 [Entrophospora sp. SA101]CAJ0830685.1 10903_t:CDS:2 [Entrophospora sp. SA101]